MSNQDAEKRVITYLVIVFALSSIFYMLIAKQGGLEGGGERERASHAHIYIRETTTKRRALILLDEDIFRDLALYRMMKSAMFPMLKSEISDKFKKIYFSDYGQDLMTNYTDS